MALTLRIVHLGRFSLWIDECYTLQTALAAKDAHLLKLLEAILHGASSYFLLFLPWVEENTAEWLLRFPSAISGVLLCGAMAALGGVIGGRRLAWTVAFAATVSPFLVWHSREARWYMVTWLLIALAGTCFFQAIRRGGWGWTAGAVAFGGIAASTFAPAITIALIQAVFLLMSSRWRRSIKCGWIEATGYEKVATFTVVVCAGATLTLWVWSNLLWPFISSGVAGYGFNNVRTPALGPIAYTAIAFATGYSIGPGPSEWHTVQWHDLGSTTVIMLTAGVASLLGLFILGARDIWAGSSRHIWFALMALSVLPTLAVVAGSLLTNHAYAPRHAGMSYPFVLCVVAAGIGDLRRRSYRDVLAAILLLLQGIALFNAYADPRYEREDVRGAATRVSELVSRDDLILVFGSIDVPWNHYYRSEIPWRRVFLKGEQPWSKERLLSRISQHKVVWYVEGRLWEEPEVGELLLEIKKLPRKTREWRFAGGVVVSRNEIQGEGT